MPNPNPNLNSSAANKGSLPSFLRLTIRREGPKLVLLLVVATVATYLWVRSVAPPTAASVGSGLTPEMVAAVKKEYDVPPIPQPRALVARTDLLISYVPVSRSDPFGALIKADVAAQGDATAAPVTPGAAVAAEPSGPAAGYAVPALAAAPVPVAVAPPQPKMPAASASVQADDIHIRGIGEAGGVFTAIVQVGGDGVLVGVGDTVMAGVKVMSIASDKVVFVRGKKEFVRPLEEGAR